MAGGRDPVLFVQRALQYLGARTRIAAGAPAPMHTPDREVLEHQILRAFARSTQVRDLLFVGCDWYTAHYERLLPGVATWTIDPDPRRARYGAARHLVAPLQELDRHIGPESFDVVVCNGVYGWGLDRRDDCERAFALCASRLRPGGLFVLGWNDVPGHDPAPLAEVAMNGLSPCRWGPFEPRWHVVGSADRHSFAFYRRDGAPGSSATSQTRAEASGEA